MQCQLAGESLHLHKEHSRLFQPLGILGSGEEGALRMSSWSCCSQRGLILVGL